MGSGVFKRGKGWVLKISAVVAAVVFVLGSVPVRGYAGTVVVDNLKTRATAQKDGGGVDIKDDLMRLDGGDNAVPLIPVLSNIISLLEGAMTGGYNIEHAVLDGANGGIFNHSEARGRLEITVSNILENLFLQADKQPVRQFTEYMKKEYIDNLKKLTNLTEKEIERTFITVEAILFSATTDNFNYKERIELVSRRIVNVVINKQLKTLVAYSNKYTFTQNVLCVGETKSQYQANKTVDILKQDLEEILNGITKEDALKIGLRIAYEPRWAIGTGLVPDAQKEIQPTHRYIKDILVKVLGVELEVDYGGSLNKNNAKEILSLPDVKGGLIGGAAKKTDEIKPVIDEAVNQGKVKGEILNIGMNWKAEDITTGLQSLKEFITIFKTTDLSKVRIAISTPQVRTVKQAMAEFEKSRFMDGGAFARAEVPYISSWGRDVLEGQDVVLRVDNNVSDKKGKIKPGTEVKIVKIIPTLVHLLKNGATVTLLSHNGRPDGKVTAESMGPIAKKIDELLKAKGYENKVVFHEGSITEKGLEVGIENKIVKGTINVLENTRFYKGEEENEPEFAKALARLGKIFIFDAFGSAEREHASTTGIANHVDRIGYGFNMEEEVTNLEAARNNLYVLNMGGGPKVKEKLGIVEGVIKNMKKGGLINLGTGPAPAFLKAVYGIEIGQKVTQEDEETAKKMIDLAGENDISFQMPVDFIAADKDLSVKAEGDKSWLDLKKLPEGTNIYYVTLEQLKQGTFKDSKTGRELSAKNLYIYDIWEKTVSIFSQAILGIPKGSSVAWNGAFGVTEIPQFASGSSAVAQAYVQATKKGVRTNTLGSDTSAMADQFEITNGVSHVSTGGSSGLAFFKGEELKVQAALQKAQSIIDVAAKLRVSAVELREYLWAAQELDNIYGENIFKGFIGNVQQLTLEGKLFIVGPEYLKLPVAISVIRSLSKFNPRIALYGKNAVKLQILIGEEIKNIKVYKSLDEILKMPVDAANTLLLRAEADSVDEKELNEKKIKQIVVSENTPAALAAAAAVTVLANSALADKELMAYITNMESAGITSKTSVEAKDKLLAELKKGMPFYFPKEVSVIDGITNDLVVVEAKKKVSKFI